MSVQPHFAQNGLLEGVPDLFVGLPTYLKWAEAATLLGPSSWSWVYFPAPGSGYLIGAQLMVYLDPLLAKLLIERTLFRRYIELSDSFLVQVNSTHFNFMHFARKSRR